jgi:hypothetical protein
MALGSLVTEAATPANIFNLGVGFWGSKTLLSAVELGLFTELAKGRADLRTLSQRLGWKWPMLGFISLGAR